MTDWRVALLRRIGARPTKQNLRFLDTWQRWEGGHTNNDARFNWLNTTRDAPGAIGSINSVGVKKFRSFEDGINALASTLKNGKYSDIVKGFRAGDPYKVKPGAGLQTWVSGSPTGNPSYAQKILGGPVTSSPARGAKPPKHTPPPGAGDEAWEYAMGLIFADDPEMADLMTSLDPTAPLSDYGPSNPDRAPRAPRGTATKLTGKTLQPGTSWGGTHVTDGLDWNKGQRTARDIMAAPGTAVLAPESGVIVRHGSAQGGQAMYFMSESGHLYWLGHIDNMLPAGTRVRKGERIAAISSDHAAPHLHIDRYYGDNPGRYT